MSITAFHKSASIVLGVALVGGATIFGAAAPASAASSCVVPAFPTAAFAGNANSNYTPAVGVTFVKVVASGGKGAAETYDGATGGAGALVTTTLAVTPGHTVEIEVGTDATVAAGAHSGGVVSGGAGDDFTIPGGDGTPQHSGGGGGGSFIHDGLTMLVAAGGGGGGGAASNGGAAGPSASAAKAAGTVTSGADGVTQAPPGGGGGTGGSSTPGTGGAAYPGYGTPSGSDGTGRTGGDAFVEPGASQSVGAGGGGGGYQGGGGGGGGGYAGGGGAGSSFATRDYTISTATGGPSVTITTVTAPVFSSATSASFTQQKAGSFTVCAPAADDPAITVSGTLPAGVTFVDNGDGTATLKGTPTGGTGKFPLTFTSTGLGGVTTQSFVLTVGASQELAVTGTDAAPAGWLALALLIGGGIVLWLRRRPANG